MLKTISCEARIGCLLLIAASASYAQAQTPADSSGAQTQHQVFYVCQLRVPGPDGAASSERLYLSRVFASAETNTDIVSAAWTFYVAKQLSLANNNNAYRYCQKSARQQDPEQMAAQWLQRAKSLGQQVTQVDWRYTPDQSPAATAAPQRQDAPADGGQPPNDCNPQLHAAHGHHATSGAVECAPAPAPSNAQVPAPPPNPQPTMHASPAPTAQTAAQTATPATTMPRTRYAVCFAVMGAPAPSVYFSEPFEVTEARTKAWSDAYRTMLHDKYQFVGTVSCGVRGATLQDAARFIEQEKNSSSQGRKIVDTGWKYE